MASIISSQVITESSIILSKNYLLEKYIRSKDIEVIRTAFIFIFFMKDISSVKNTNRSI